MTVEKGTLLSLCLKNRFVASTHTIVFNKLETLGRSFTCIKSGRNIDPCGTPHVTFCSFALLSLLVQMYRFLFLR